MLFQKLVEQHRVHLVVADAVGFPFFIAHHQVRIDRLHVLGHKAELRHTCRINLFFIMEGNRFERVERFTGLLYWFNALFKALRGCDRAKSAVSINKNGRSSGRRCVENVADKAAIVHVHTIAADTNNVIGRGDIHAGKAAQCDVVAAGGIPVECKIADSCVAGAGGVAKERLPTVGGVGASGVVKERLITRGRVASAVGVVKEGVNADGRVEAAYFVVTECSEPDGRINSASGVVEKGEHSVCRIGVSRGIVQKRPGAGGRVLPCGVGKKRPGANGRVETVCSVAQERQVTDCRIVSSGSQVKKGVLSFRSVPPGVVAVWRRVHRLRVLDERDEDQSKCD